jgi:hypothetical protein
MPFDDDLNDKPILTLSADDHSAVAGAKAGQTGKLSCRFKVLEDELTGTVQLELSQVEIETKNAADKELESMTAQPAEEIDFDEEVDKDENDDI